MRTIFMQLAIAISAMLPGSVRAAPTATAKEGWTIFCPQSPSPLESLAAREVRRYVYLRTGQLIPIQQTDRSLPDKSNAIVVARRDSPVVSSLPLETPASLSTLEPQGYLLKTIPWNRRQVVLVVGGDDVGTLYAAYRLAELLGVRFYLHGDVTPDGKVELKFPNWAEEGKPLFKLRGIQPFHDFPEGPDWWNRDDYFAIISQLPKLRMNFIGLHTYPEGRPNAEPTVWIGLPEDIGEGGQVKFSYPSSYQNTQRGNWGYAAKKTSEFLFGAAELYERDDFGPDAMGGFLPEPDTPEKCNAVFNRTGAMLRDAFRHAHQLGIKTCVGTETPLVVPKLVAEKLKARDKSPTNAAVIQALYEGIFRRATQAYDLDYYWFWTPEDWTWKGSNGADIQTTTNDLFAAIAAAEKVKAPFQLATCGWVLGPPEDRARFDKILPKEVAVSCINREVGKTPVEKGFAEVNGRSKWAIPWLEDDPALTVPQLWAGRMRRDAADALRYGCDGLMGIHWRTRILSPNVSALAQAAWEQGDGNTSALQPAQPPPTPVLPRTDDFYGDWALAQFGLEVASQTAATFIKLDGRLPRPADWVHGPGGIKPDKRPWENVRKEYEFVDLLAALRPKVKGAGHLERFDYWLNNFRYLRAMAQVNCTWFLFTHAMSKAKAEEDPAARKQLARQTALPLRVELLQAVGEVYQYLLATISNPGELGTIANWEQHLLPGLLETPGKELAELLGEDLPADAQPSRAYCGTLRVIVPTVRSSIAAGEALELKVIILAERPPREATLYSRSLGEGTFAHTKLTHLARGVYSATLPVPGEDKTGLEYYIKVVPRKGRPVYFPATAPAMNQTLVVQPSCLATAK